MSTQTENKTNTLNGVDLNALGEMVQTVKAQPQMGKGRFRAKNIWVQGGYNRSSIVDFDAQMKTIAHARPFVIEADEPPVLLGNDLGANPVEILLSALSSCMTTSLVYHAAAEGIKIEKIQSEYEGDIDLSGFLGLNPDVRKGYSEIRAKFKIKGDLDEEKAIALFKRSPVYDVVSRGTPIKITVEKQS